jgi:regulator of cell morphogenesis and NO signaling
MPNPISSIKALYHFEPLSELALQRYSISPDGLTVEHYDPNGDRDIEFVLELMEVYADVRCFDEQSFARHSLFAILEYLERTHLFYEMSLLPKMEQAIVGVKRLFPDHPISDLLDIFFRNYKNELLEHIDIEERDLFPYARRLSHGGSSRDYSVKEFQVVHNHRIEDALNHILSVVETDYPEVARSFAYRTFRNLLEQFRLDLHIHHLIEDRVFLQKLLTLEQNTNTYPFQ